MSLAHVINNMSYFLASLAQPNSIDKLIGHFGEFIAFETNLSFNFFWHFQYLNFANKDYL